MPDSFQAATLLALALVPGALYVWSFERQAGRYGIGLSDRVLRFVGGSAVFLALFTVPLYAIRVEYGEAIVSGEPLPLWLGLVPVVYVAVPVGAGLLVGYGLRQGWGWVSAVTGPDPAPRAWDYLFQYNVNGWVRCKLKSGTRLGGAYANANGRRSYAAGYPEPQDLYLAATLPVDPETGEFEVDEGGARLGGGGVLVRWEEVEYLEFIES